MNTRIVKIIFSLGLLIMLTGISANAQDVKLKANIPFNFTVGDVHMYAGDIEVARLNIGNGSVFRVRDEDFENVVARLAMMVTSTRPKTDSLLIFNRYVENGGEESYFLSQMWVEGESSGFEFLKHRVEREAAKRAAKRDIITIVVPRTSNRAE